MKGLKKVLRNLTIASNFQIVLGLIPALISCEKSPFGPVVVEPKQLDTEDDTLSNTSTTLDTLSCTMTPSRSVFYGGSSISQKLSCNQLISKLDLTTAPNFISGMFSGTDVTFSGTAPATASTNSWTFLVNDNKFSPVKIKTNILDPSTLVSQISPPTSFSSVNGSSSSNSVAFDLGHKCTLDSSWDGSIADAILSTSAISSDIPSLNFYNTCSSSTGSYVCNGNQSGSDKTANNGLTLLWRWSAFDQGSYYLDITPQIKIEGTTTTLPTQTFNATIPIQSSGNVQVTAANDPDSFNSYDAQKYRYGVAISNLSTALTPVVGLLYTDKAGGVRSYFQRITIDRTSTPGGSSSGLTENGSYLLQTNANSQDFSINQLRDGSWAVVGGTATNNSFDVLFNRVNDSSTSPTLNGSSTLLTNFSGTVERALNIATTKPFTENGTERIGFAYVRKNNSNSQGYLTVAKLNPTGTSSAAILDLSLIHI